MIYLAMMFLGLFGGNDPQPNIIVVVVDALRRDCVSVYNGRPDLTPSLQEFVDANYSVIFEDTYTASSQTKLSIASLFTGLNPPEHGIRKAQLGSSGTSASRMVESHTTMAELFKAKGYQTIGLVTNPHLKAEYGFGQGFDHYEFHPSRRTRANALVALATSLLDARDQSKPVFLYLHFMDVHAPYAPPAEYRPGGRCNPFQSNGVYKKEMDFKRLKCTRKLYEAQIPYWDHCFNELVKYLYRNHLMGNTLVVIASDHGDEFFEHGGLGHGHTVWDELVQVPLIMVTGDEKLLRKVDGRGQHSLIDVLPLLCGLVGLDDPAEGVRRPIYCEAPNEDRPVCFVFDDGKLILTRKTGEVAFYAGGYEEEQALLEDYSSLVAAADSVAIDEQTRKQLKSLGY